jgi:hypothetical protein
MREFKPPQQIESNGLKSIFLAGTIDIGNSEDWQSIVVRAFEKTNVNILNPRRVSWDDSWVQTFENPQFYQQVNWELDAMEKADIIILYLAAGSKSPISLLEFGLHARSRKLYVYCPDDFYRSGNVQIVCDRYNIPLYKDLGKLINKVKDEIK